MPFVPAGRHAVLLRHVAVQILADHRRAVAGGLQPGGERRLLEPEPVERLVAAPGRLVADDVGVVGILAAQDRGARRAAPRIADEVVRERGALILDQRLGLRHEGVRADILVVGQDQDDVVPGGLGDRLARHRAEAQADGQGSRQDLASARRHAGKQHLALRYLCGFAHELCIRPIRVFLTDFNQSRLASISIRPKVCLFSITCDQQKLRPHGPQPGYTTSDQVQDVDEQHAQAEQQRDAAEQGAHCVALAIGVAVGERP